MKYDLMCEGVDITSWGSIERDDITYEAHLSDGSNIHITVVGALFARDEPVPFAAGEVYSIEVKR